MILLYRRLLWRTGDIFKNIPITLYHRFIPGEYEKDFQEDPNNLLYCHQLIAGAYDVLTSNNNSHKPAQFLQPHNKAFETLLP